MARFRLSYKFWLQRFEVTDPTFDTTMVRDAWDFYGTLYNRRRIFHRINGPWWFIQQITAADISGGVFHSEWLDANHRVELF
jgi:hypothetical protein